MNILALFYICCLCCLHNALGSPINANETLGRTCGNEVTDEEVMAIEEKIRLDLGKMDGNVTDPSAGRIASPIHVVWHVIYNTPDTAGGYLARGTIFNSINAMSYHYAGSGFSFTLDRVSYTQNRDWFFNAIDGSPAESAMKRALNVNLKDTLNVYSINAAFGVLGYATFPWKYSSNPWKDSVVILHSTVPGGGFTNYNQGKTLTHEVGHWLGLYHVFEGNNCAGNGDFVADTPPQKDPTMGCPSSKSSCPGNGGDSIHNYMDYSYDVCMNQFTPGQIYRARIMAKGYRGISV
ncbi:hypothetical protein FRC18_004025 [Serendipita sp. 400]|nr:hypothetical protein FRC18_004025 [Serendipita sp. 400]